MSYREPSAGSVIVGCFLLVMGSCMIFVGGGCTLMLLGWGGAPSLGDLVFTVIFIGILVAGLAMVREGLKAIGR